MNVRDLEHIVWDDHWNYGGSGWTSDEPKDQLKYRYRVNTVGFVLSEDKQQLVLASHVATSGQYTGVMVIIKKCIVSRKILKRNVKLS